MPKPKSYTQADFEAYLANIPSDRPHHFDRVVYFLRGKVPAAFITGMIEEAIRKGLLKEQKPVEKPSPVRSTTTTVQQMAQGHSLQLDSNMLEAIKVLVEGVVGGFTTLRDISMNLTPTVVGSSTTTEVEKG